jgi:hypothetical protein
LQGLYAHRIVDADEAEQQVLRADVVVTAASRLILGVDQNLPGSVRELVESIHVPGGWPAPLRLNSHVNGKVELG